MKPLTSLGPTNYQSLGQEEGIHSHHTNNHPESTSKQQHAPLTKAQVGIKCSKSLLVQIITMI